LQEGADADIVVFDAGTISDRWTLQKPMEPSVGVRYLVVGGIVVVDDGKIAADAFPGRHCWGPESAQRRSTSYGLRYEFTHAIYLNPNGAQIVDTRCERALMCRR
jgi:hypothetical protein